MELAKEIEKKIGQLQYEISLLGHDMEEMTGVSERTDELKDLVKKLTLGGVVKQSEQLKCNHNLVRQGRYIVCRKKDCSYKILG